LRILSASLSKQIVGQNSKLRGNLGSGSLEWFFSLPSLSFFLNLYTYSVSLPVDNTSFGRGHVSPYPATLLDLRHEKGPPGAAHPTTASVIHSLEKALLGSQIRQERTQIEVYELISQ
jgi:hypothetical protein